MQIHSTCAVRSCADRWTKRLLFCRSRLEKVPNDTTWERPSSRDSAVRRARPWGQKQLQQACSVLVCGYINKQHNTTLDFGFNSVHFCFGVKYMTHVPVSYLIGEENIDWEEKQSDPNNCSSCSFAQSLQESRVGLSRHTLVLVWVFTWKLRQTCKKKVEKANNNHKEEPSWLHQFKVSSSLCNFNI